MLNAIHLQLNDDLSEQDISTLNDIYNSHWSHRSEQVIVRKIILLLLNLFSAVFNVGIATVLIKRRKQFRNVTFTTSLAGLNLFIITAYVSAFYSVNNTVCTPAFNGSLYCATKIQAQLQVARNVWFQTMFTASRWLILIIAGMQYDNDSLHNQYTWLGYRLLWPTHVVVLLVLALSCLAHIPHCIPTYTEYVTPYIRASGFCYTWQLYVIVDVIDWICDFVSALGLVICSTVFLIKKRKVKKARLQNKLKQNKLIGTRALRHSLTTETNSDPIIEASIFTGKKFQELVLVAFFTIGTWLPTVLRHIVIMCDKYNIDDYLLDEKICDIFDMLLLMNNTIVIFIYYTTCRISSHKRLSLSLSSKSPISIARRMSHASSRTLSRMSKSPKRMASHDVSVNKPAGKDVVNKPPEKALVNKPHEKDLVNKPFDEVKASGEVEPSRQVLKIPLDPDKLSDNSSKVVHFKRLPM